MQANIINLDQEAHHAVDRKRDDECDHNKNQRAIEQWLISDLIERNHHDFRRENQVCENCRLHQGIFILWCAVGRLLHPLLLSLIGRDSVLNLLPDLFHALKAQVGATEHQNRRQRPGQKLT